MSRSTSSSKVTMSTATADGTQNPNPPPPTSLDLWSQIVAEENQDYGNQIDVVFRRRKPRNDPNNANSMVSDDIPRRPSRVSFADPNKRISWKRSLSTRGRISIAVGASMVYQPELKKDKRKGKPPAIPKGKNVKAPNFDKERLYFQEVDAFELMEESPSPKKVGTWIVGNNMEEVPLPSLCSRLERWLHSRRLNPRCGPSSRLSKILDTPTMNLEVRMRSLDQSGLSNSQLSNLKSGESNRSLNNASLIESEGCEDVEAGLKKLSLTSTTSSIYDDHNNPFSVLLEICGQSAPSMLQDLFSRYSGSETVVKVGEGTYGEAFKVGNCVCKIVPFDGDLRVNGEIQKKSEELLEEVLLSKTLNQLRGNDGVSNNNLCRTFIESKEFRVCQGLYDEVLVRAWEDWDHKHNSENDHPNEFPEQQCYMVFVQQHGGKDLEGFVLLNFDEARTLLVQVAAGLAVAESAYEFEHRDLHWGNILVSRSDDSATLQFTLDGKNLLVETYGLMISIIDFTLSRMNTGDSILYLDLSADPDLFKGPKGDKQSETYRKMKEVTEDWWEGSFPKTNVLWLVYLVDILLTKKTFERTSKDERDLRSLKKRLDKYNSAKEAVFDPFFTDLFVESNPMA
ncbi:serine/threonine-protein kinase haspin homolog [Lathyrus oleraceus]|uniref:non-specific serine/threonine protein kinase n=2 Tax=Pisum sativum TaxID=3888 RepID=A0A9D5AUB4_PEA|nr:serine/threonine-protein kinase haspin homolog [Pisum sativum]KAI5424627.1 hypothetical protein KIW84_030711 [Pisum sativum]